jgi:dihydroflavonol-4-reductase
VTGATGFLGSHLCRALVDRGRAITALERPSSSREGLAELPLSWATAEITDAPAVRRAVEGHARVFHLAGVGLGNATAQTVRRVNCEGTRAVVAACEAAGVDRLVFVSTAGTRRSEGRADETDLARPIGAYQESKRVAEQTVDAATQRGLDAVTVHPTSVFGPGDRTFTARLLTLSTRPSPVYLPGGASIVGVADVVEGLIAAMDRGQTGEHYILGGENLTYREALTLVADVADERCPPIRVPESVVHAAGPVVGAVNELLDTRLFPFDSEMATLVTDRHFYSSARARTELDYHTEPFAALVEPAMEWFGQTG